uniref:Uncharacterized protein n=1 Tax=Oryza brachyantha TaxID=4533 RepID=J3L610_ORYBR
MPLIGRGIIQVWCLLAPSEEDHQPSIALNKNNSSNPPRPRGRPRKTSTTSDDHLEPSLKRPRGRPRKYPLTIAKVKDSSQNDRSQDFGLTDPLVSSAVNLCDAVVACAMPTVKSVEPTPRRGRGRPRKKPVEKKGLSGTELTEDMSTALICTEPKRKRGRPRKYPAPINSKHLPGTDNELGNDTVSLPGSIDCSLGPTETTGSGANLTPVAVDAAFPVPSSSSAICDRKSGQRGRQQPEKEVSHGAPCWETITNDPNSMPSGHPDVGSMLPTYILSNSSSKSESGGTRVRGQPRNKLFPSTTSCLFATGMKTPKQASILTNSDNLIVLAKSDGDVISDDMGICLAKCKDESCAKRGRGRPKKKQILTRCTSTECNDEEQKITIPESSYNAALVGNCKKESCPRKSRLKDKKKSAFDEHSSLAFSVEAQKMNISSASIMSSSCLALIGSCVNEDTSNEVGLIGYKSGPVGCDIMKMREINTFESAQANQAVSVPFENGAPIIEGLEDTEVTPLKESTKVNNMICSAEKIISPVPKDVSLPRVVLCLAHNGKVAWDIKWKPPLANQSEQKSRLGFLAVLLGNGSIEVIPLTVDWSPSHDMILAGCHDGTVALWKFSTNLSFEGSKPFMCVTAESAPIRTVSWAPSMSEENVNTFVTAGEDGLKFWDLRDPYRPLWELTTAPRAVLSLQWLKDARGIVISLEDGTLKFLSLSRTANDVSVTGRPFAGTKTQGVSTYQLSEYLIWSVHASEITGYAAYCVADGTAVFFELTPRFWEKEPGRNRVPYFLCGSLTEVGTTIKIDITSQNSPLSNVPLGGKRAAKTCKDVGKLLTYSEYNCTINSDVKYGQQDVPDKGKETDAAVLAPSMQENIGASTSRGSESPESFEVFPPKAVALHRLRWNMNKGSERWLCYGGAAGIVRCQRI